MENLFTPEMNSQIKQAAMTREIVGRASNYRSCYYNQTFDLVRLKENIRTNEGIVLDIDEIRNFLISYINDLIKEYSDIFSFDGSFEIKNQITFIIKVSPKPLPVENKGLSEIPRRTITSAELDKNGFDEDPHSREYTSRR